MLQKGINTLPRILFLNTYAVLLAIIGGLCIFLGLMTGSVVIQYSLFAIAVVAFYLSRKIILNWESKKRVYEVLMRKNENKFIAESFSEQMQAPCGRLLVRVVLSDLGLENKYKELTIYKFSFSKTFKQNYAKKATYIYINPNYRYGTKKD